MFVKLFTFAMITDFALGVRHSLQAQSHVFRYAYFCNVVVGNNVLGHRTNKSN